MSKIERLTKAQLDKIPFYFNKWTKIGLEYAPIDIEEAKKRLLPYLLIGDIRPKYFLKFTSPFLCELAINILRRSQLYSQLSSQLRSQLYSQLGSQLDSQLDSQLYSQLGSQLDSQLDSQLCSQLHSQLHLQLDSQLGSQLGSQLYSQLGSQLSSQLYSQLDSQLCSQLDSQLGSQLYSQLGSQLYSQLGSQLSSQLYSQLGSQLDSQLCSQLTKIKMEYFPICYWAQSGNIISGYCAFYDFLLGEVKKIDVPWGTFTNVISYFHYFWVFKDFVFISEKPKYLKFNSKNQLHCENGIACEYLDGWGLYSLNGVSVPAEIVLTPAEKLDAKILLKEKNAEVRREIVRKMGIDLVCQRLNARVIDSGIDHVGQPCELLSLDLGDGRFRPYLKLLNPSIKTFHIEGVEPSCNTIEKAFAFRNGTKEKPIIVT